MNGQVVRILNLIQISLMKRIDECCEALNYWAYCRLNSKSNTPIYCHPFRIVGNEIKFNYKEYFSPIILANIDRSGTTMIMDNFLFEHIECILLKYNIKYFTTKYNSMGEFYELRNNKYMQI